MWHVAFSVVLIGFADGLLENDVLEKNEVKVEHFVYWPNGTIPFYIHPDHFDHEQSSIILTALTTFAYKTCLKFLPALVAPNNGQHVLVIENPNGVRQCVVSSSGHVRDEPHYLILGYDCLKSPQIDMMLMKAIGFSFEHNRAIRDLYIRVQKENVMPSALDLFVMDDKLPTELRALPYDVNSVMHFSERDYSKNGHRTILFLDHKVKQCREGLSDIDLRKIDTVYGPECRKRDRLEKIDLCQGYPGVARKKRSVDDDDDKVRDKRDTEPTEHKSLRVNPDITPPPEVLNTTEKDGRDINVVMEELGLKDAVEEVTNLVYKLGARALTNVRLKHCNVTDAADVEVKNATEGTESGRRAEDKKPDIMGVVEMVADYIQDMVDHALTNLTAFCEVENDLKAYQRQRCNWDFGDRCPVNYKSTNVGLPRYSTKHRPYIPQSTKHIGGINQRIVLYHQGRRDDGGGLSDNPGDAETRRKRETEINDGSKKEIEAERRFEGRRYNVRNQSDGARWDHSDVTMEHSPKKKRFGPRGLHVGKIPAEGQRIKVREARATNALPKVVELTAKNKEFYGERMWPDGFVRYVVTEDTKYDLTDLRRRLGAVNRILKQRTCVSLEEITEEDAERFEDYLVLDGSADYITGKVGGRQNFGSLELFEGGQHKQHAAMMVMAMLGFYFELSRHDRDKYVRVHLRHVRPDKLHHFEKIRSDATLALPYDYESATHPAWQFWRQIGKTGISTVATYKEKDPDGTIMRSFGQHDHLLSETDIIKINSVYGIDCFKKKPQRFKNDDIVDHGSVLEVDLTKKKKKVVEVEVTTKKKNIYELETWVRHKPKEEERHSDRDDEEEKHRDKDNEEARDEDRDNEDVRNEDRDNEEVRHKDRDNEKERHEDRDNEEQRHRDSNDEEERHEDRDNEEDRDRDRDNHGRDRNRHRNKHGSRNEDFDDGSREHHREREIHSNRHKKEGTVRDQIQEREKRINRDKYEREHGKRNKYTEDRDKRDRQRKRPQETDEDREEQERIQGKHRQSEKGRGRYKEYESDRERQSERSGEEERHGRDQNSAEGGRERYREREDKQHNEGVDMEYKDDDTNEEGDSDLRQKNTNNAEAAYSRENNRDDREEIQENNPDYGHGESIGYQDEMRRGREQIYAPIQNRQK